jgi:glycosyltransferase involved in cell wall biosynthesis
VIARLPLAVSNFPELRRFVEITGTGVLMNEKDPRDIARAIGDAYDNKDHLRLNAHRLRQFEEVYGWPAQKGALKRVYSSVTRLPGQPSTFGVTLPKCEMLLSA